MNRTSPVLPFLFAVLILHSWEVRGSLSPQFSSEVLLQSHKDESESASVDFLILQTDSVGKTCIQAQVKSPITSSLQAGEEGG